jgi:hypothetical protein
MFTSVEEWADASDDAGLKNGGLVPGEGVN